MNLNTLKNFAPAVRRQLIEAVGRKLDFVLTGDTPDLRDKATQRSSIKGKAEKDRPGLVERVAYTWFNRLAALRFLDARGWHPFLCRVLTPANTGETQPEILKLTRNGALPAELAPFADTSRINDLLDGRIPSTDPQSEVYRHLILAACRYYHDLMPFLFEALDDETELLLPDDLLTEHSAAQGFRSAITDEDCAEVEIIGWLYQFYISEKKDQVMARKSAVPTEDIPAVTQLFTPHWIVRYLVENSLGRLWLLNRPGSRLREHMPYYIEGEHETDFLKITKPEEIRLLDPASGSGHMLTYSFDLLYLIYEEEGHAPSEIPGLILRHNLFGLEICPRATQLAQFALVCKAREKSRLAFRNSIQPQVMCLEDVDISPEEMKDYLRLPGLRELFTEKVLRQIHQFRENTSTFGSLIQPILTVEEIATLKARLATVNTNGDLLHQETHRKTFRALYQAEMLSQHYHVVVANPPYMGSKFHNRGLKNFLEETYPEELQDTYTCFISRSYHLVKDGGMFALITLPSWMALPTFSDFRTSILRTSTLLCLNDNGRGVWGPDYGSCAFVFLRRHLMRYPTKFARLFARRGEVNRNEEIEQNYLEKRWVEITKEELAQIPGTPLAYWTSSAVRHAFTTYPALSTIGEAKNGMTTGENDKFLRFWFEVARRRISFDRVPGILPQTVDRPWVPYSKGGEFRKWFGNTELILNWGLDGKHLRANRPKTILRNPQFYFREAITWSLTSMLGFGARHRNEGFTFDVNGMSLFVDAHRQLYVLAFLNSRIARDFLEILNPTIAFQAGDIGRLPILENVSGVVANANICLEAATQDWDNFENSWDFHDQPLLRPGVKASTLEVSWRNWEAQSTAAINRMRELETENNQLFIDAYGLQEELTPDVPEEQITLARPDRCKDMAAFLSYAIGCIMGRYSLDASGLILADARDTLENYLAKIRRPLDQLTFAPDVDGIIPMLDGEWFEDDIVARTRDFLRVTFGEETLEENLSFIEESLGKDLRKYFLTDFHKDHLQTYKKRPIYWLFQSPKKGFSALIYLHRYTRDTVNVMLNRYLRDYMHKLRSRIEHLEHVQSNSGSAREKTAARKESDTLKKTLRECEEYEREVILPLAQQRIELDLDDGVKVNYLKFGKALAPIPGLAAKEEEG